MSRFEIRVVASTSGVQVEAPPVDRCSMVFDALVVEEVTDPSARWSRVLVSRVGDDAEPLEQPEDSGDIVVRGTLMDLPKSAKPSQAHWDTALVQIAATPRPELVADWLARAAGLTVGHPLARLAWFELDDVEQSRPWGEFHMATVESEAAARAFLDDPRWVAARPHLERVINPRREFITKPIINDLGALALLG